MPATSPVPPAPHPLGDNPAVSDVIAAEALTTQFQPIIGLRDGVVMGYEALSRGPAGTTLEHPRDLFAHAVSEGCVGTLERACWSTALRRAARFAASARIQTCVFINILPDAVADDGFLQGILSILAESPLAPHDIVVEITEGMRIEDYTVFNRWLEPFRMAGLRVAVDDAGSGHSGLQTIVELNPDFVKIDRALVAGLDRLPARRSAVEALVSFTRRQSIGLVAEGIESADELMEARRLGVQYAQGYFVARPTDQLAPPNPEAASLLQTALRHGAGVLIGTGRSLAAGDILTPTPGIATGTEVGVVAELFRTRRLDGLAVTRDLVPAGLVMRDRLYQVLAKAYGRELFLRRPIETVANAEPLIVDARLSLVEVSRRATARPAETRYDHVIVVRDGTYLGTIAVHRVLEAMTDLKVAWARMENPLTGLPGNPAIEEELATRIAEGRSVAALHVDLDRFKAFNDAYGFHQGDKAIRLLAEILTQSTLATAGPDAFVGHVGGDDFIVLLEPESAGATAAAVLERFAARVATIYPAGAADGAMTVTVASAVEPGGPTAHSAEFLHRLARAKGDAKARSCGLPHDRRR